MNERVWRDPIEYGFQRDLGITMSELTAPSGFPETCEDGTFTDLQRGVAIVVDGDGVAKTGVNAKDRALSTLQKGMHVIRSEDPDRVATAMRTAFLDAHSALVQDRHSSRASATAVKIVDTEQGRSALIGSVGLTRAYLLHDGELERLTTGHGTPTVARYEEEVIAGIDSVTTREEYHQFTRTRFGSLRGEYFWKRRFDANYELGVRLPREVPVYEVPLEKGDSLLVATRGMQNLPFAEIEEHLKRGRGSRSLEALVQRAKEISEDESSPRSFKDDISGVRIDMDESKSVEHVSIPHGESVRVRYNNGQPLTLVLPDGQTLIVGTLPDLGFGSDDRFQFGLINTSVAERTKNQRGIYGLIEGEGTFVEKDQRTSDWQIRSTGSNRNEIARIDTQGPVVTFTDLSSGAMLKIQRDVKTPPTTAQ
jgi:serine/threonine protein phosphatase PrpC